MMSCHQVQTITILTTRAYKPLQLVSFRCKFNAFNKEEFMTFLTSTIISGIVYDGLKTGTSLGADFLKDKLQNWLIDDAQLTRLADQIDEMVLNDDMSEKAITRQLDSNAAIVSLLQQVKPQVNTTITQTHSGTGDNIGRDQINYK